jgi:hypothetical protein
MNHESCCGCGCTQIPEKRVLVEYLYLDLNTCDRCIGTDQELEEVVSIITPALKLAGYSVETQKIEIATKELAEKHRFLSSPTIRVNGKDICQTVSESDCGCCGEISGTQVDCRVFEYGEETFEVPPKEMLASAILQAIFGGPEDGCGCGEPDEYVCPPNLVSFFEGKKEKTCSCEGNCCS